MDRISEDELRDRFITGFLASWPKRDVPEEQIASTFAVVLGSDDDGPTVTVGLLGTTVTHGFDGTVSGANEAIDEIATSMADQAEDDRWFSGGWRE